MYCLDTQIKGDWQFFVHQTTINNLTDNCYAERKVKRRVLKLYYSNIYVTIGIFVLSCRNLISMHQ